MYDIELDDVTKRFDGDVVALDHLSLLIRAGELFGIVGPSGCGKTTALRILAGLERPTEGRVRIGGTDVTDVDTQSRRLGLITQSNQLLGHLSARRNISFPLDVRRRGEVSGIDERVTDEAAGLGIEHLLHRKPRTLSHGERRSVQLARAVINAPATLLMDEPLANLEDQIRMRLRTDLVRIHRARGLTSLLVTASQADAMAMCDRIAVLFGGVLHQVAAPADLYHRPATSRVAGFFGEPAMNLFEAPVRADGAGCHVRILGRDVRLWSPDVDEYAGRSLLVGVRAEDLELGGRADDSVEVRVSTTEPLGHRTLAVAETPDGTRLHCAFPGAPPPLGTVIDVGVRGDRLHLFDPDTELAIAHPSAT